MSLVPYLIDLVLGPIGLVLNLGDLQVLLNDANNIISMATSGNLNQVVSAIQAGQFAQSGHLVANGVGTILWLVVLGGLLEGLGEVAEVAEVLD